MIETIDVFSGAIRAPTPVSSALLFQRRGIRYLLRMATKQHSLRNTLLQNMSSFVLASLVMVSTAVGFACASRSELSEVPAEASLVQCVEPRPTICTREYLPVCGIRTDGSEWTYGNSCSACGHGTVTAHRPGACSSGS
ncbi:MAG: hypothetical protein GY944_26335 [bacterium]|nr:hypothetical protein [bacterium]